MGRFIPPNPAIPPATAAALDGIDVLGTAVIGGRGCDPIGE